MSNTSNAFSHPQQVIKTTYFAGILTFMRLPTVMMEDAKIVDVDIGLIEALQASLTTALHFPYQLAPYGLVCL